MTGVSQLRRITCQKFAARAILAGDMVEWKSTLFINSEILSSIPDGCSVFLVLFQVLLAGGKGIAGYSRHCCGFTTREEMYKPAPMLPTREELISVRRAEARALLRAAYQLQSNTTATAPNRIIGAANDLIGALHIVGRQDAVNSIMRIMHSVEDWSAAHQHELKMRRQSELKLKQGLSQVESELDKMEREREQQQEFDDSFLDDQATIDALVDAERNAAQAPPTPPLTPPDDLDDGALPPPSCCCCCCCCCCRCCCRCCRCCRCR